MGRWGATGNTQTLTIVAVARQHLVVGVDLLLQLVDGVLRDVLVLAAVRHGVTETLHGVLHRPDQQHTRDNCASTPLRWIFKNALCKKAIHALMLESRARAVSLLESG